jgi:hypothetical protein
MPMSELAPLLGESRPFLFEVEIAEVRNYPLPATERKASISGSLGSLTATAEAA